MSDFLQAPSILFKSLLLRCLQCRIWNPWSKPGFNLDDFNTKVINPVGNGAFNRVYRCHQLDNHRVVAIKEVVISDENEAVSINKRITFLQELHHENVVRLLDTFKRRNYIYIVFEYITPDLYYFISLPDEHKYPHQRNYLLYQTLSAVAHYHSHDILLGDLKPQNLRMDFRDGLLKLADFCFGGAYGDPNNSYTIATSQYSAPELLLGSDQYSKPADVWSVGCIFGEIVTKQAVFHGKSQKDQLTTIFRLLGTPTEDSWPGVTALRSSLSSFPKFEPMDLTVKFPGLEPEGLDILSKMLCLDPNKRISAEDALNHAFFNNSLCKPPRKKGPEREIGTSSQQVQSSTN